MKGMFGRNRKSGRKKVVCARLVGEEAREHLRDSITKKQ